MNAAEEARENIHCHCDGCIVYADAYALASRLAGHVGACVMKEWFAPGPDSGAWHDCGDGWYCDGAKQYIKELENE